jgi:Raf kinase inhibitor-like YbhB/YbcL family protein
MDGGPRGARSFTLVVEDPDAPHGTFRHWAAFDIAPDRDHLPEGVQKKAEWASLRQGRNDFGNVRYDGSAPRGHGPHHYHFRLAALDAPSLAASDGASKRLGDSPASMFSKKRSWLGSTSDKAEPAAY